jgi:5'-nucleotidase
MRTRLSVVSLAALSIILGACAALDEPGDPADDAFLAGGKTDVFGVGEGTAQACGVLQLVNTADLDALDHTVKLDSRAAHGIYARRVGRDGAAGTADDAVFHSLAELDAVPYVGKVAFRKLLDAAIKQGLTCTTGAVQLLAVADFHGQLDPAGTVGGAAVLASWFAADRAQNPGTVTLSAGDLFGASPPLAMYFEEQPVVDAWSLMKLDAEVVGNHDFDRGAAHLEAMARRAQFPFVSANLANTGAAMTCPEQPGQRCIRPFVTFMRNGLKVAVVGLTTPELPDLVKPGALGPIVVTDMIEAAQAAWSEAAFGGAQIFVLVAHLGGTPAATAGAEPTGPLVDLARALSGFDVVIGGHTHNDLNAVVNGVPVVQTKSAGGSYAKVAVTWDYASSSVTGRTATLVVPATTVTPDAAVAALLDPYRTELAAAFDQKVATATAVFERGNNVERLREVALGDLLADAIRVRYGTQIAIVNGGGIRAPLPSSYQPLDKTLRRADAGYAAGPPYDVVVGDAYAILPFGNATVTRAITGAQLWAALEHSVDSLPAAKGYFAQISGFRFVFDSTKAPGGRVVSVALENGTPIAKDETSYTLATSDFIAAGGDGYTMLAGPFVTQDPMAEVLLAHIQGLGTVSPQLAQRIVDQPTP